MKREILMTNKAPAPIGPYSQAVRLGGFIYCSGQISLDSQTGEIIGQGDVEAQTVQVMKNIQAVLTDAAGAGFEDVVKTTIFLKSMDDFPKVNAIYGKCFESNPPARSCVEVSRLPKDVLVEIEIIAFRE